MFLLLQPHQNSLILHAFMDLFCAFVRVNIFSEKASTQTILYLLFSTLYIVEMTLLRRKLFSLSSITDTKENDVANIQFASCHGKK